MKVLIAGSTGMVGSVVMKECLASSIIKQVICLVRKSSRINHEKLSQVVINSFNYYDQKNHLFEGVNMSFFCVGAYTGNVKDDEFKK